MSSAPAQTSVARVVAASFIGTAIEWYDFFLYGTAAALVFNRLFFPSADPLTGTMAAFATYAVGFFARPFGGVLFGHFGDRFGRKSALIATLMIVGLSTFCIGLLPTYETAGVLAPVLLVALRFVQGLGVGGEWAGAVLMVAERGDPRWRGFSASWVQAGAPVGLILATAAFGLASSLCCKPWVDGGPGRRLRPHSVVASIPANSFSSAESSTGLTRWKLNPASVERRRSSACPQPVKATRITSRPHCCCRIRRATS
jgi:MFS transporter, MHS family, shikimate and dehydroshikimate transport protein